MKTKKRLKRWVVNLIGVVNFTSLLLLGSEANNLSVFIIGHIIALVVFIISAYILIKNIND